MSGAKKSRAYPGAVGDLSKWREACIAIPMSRFTSKEPLDVMDLSTHPCFDNEARLKYARVHLPVAPACNVQCNFCDRKFDCANESRPGVTSVLLDPAQAARYVDEVVMKDPSIRVVGIAGPGDPLAPASGPAPRLRRQLLPEPPGRLPVRRWHRPYTDRSHHGPGDTSRPTSPTGTAS